MDTQSYMTKVQKFKGPEGSEAKTFLIFQYQHTTSGIAYYSWENMFLIRSSLALKDFCYIDHIALRTSRLKSRRRGDKAARAENPMEAPAWFTLRQLKWHMLLHF